MQCWLRPEHYVRPQRTEQIHFVRFRCLAVDRVTEEQEYIDLVAGDACCDLLVAALSGSQGGDQQIAARISCNEIDVLLFFRDPINRKASEPNEMNLLRLCDVHNVPVATNIATAEALIMALERGDLDWREIGNPTI